MQATIEINSQRGQVSGSLVFNPARFTNTAEHAFIQSTFDKLLSDLNVLAKNNAGKAVLDESKDVPTPVTAPAPIGTQVPEKKDSGPEKAQPKAPASVFGPQSPKIPDPIAFPVKLTGEPVKIEGPSKNDNESEKTGPGSGNDALKSRLEQAAVRSGDLPKVAGAVVPNAPPTNNLSDKATQQAIGPVPAPTPAPKENTE